MPMSTKKHLEQVHQRLRSHLNGLAKRTPEERKTLWLEEYGGEGLDPTSLSDIEIYRDLMLAYVEVIFDTQGLSR